MSGQRRGAGQGKGRKDGGRNRSRSGSGPSRSGGSGRSSGSGEGTRRGKASGPPSRRGGPAPGRGRRPSSSRGLGGDHVEGRQAVRELLLAQTRRVREIVMVEDLDRADILDDISELSFEMKVPLRSVPRRRFESEAFTESHQGVMAKADPLPERTLLELAEVPRAHLLVLDGVTDPGNLGSLLRTADCAGVTGVVLARHRAVHVSPTVTKIAAGAVEHLPMAIVGGIPTAIKDLNDLGVLTIGLDMEGETPIFGLPLDTGQPVALVLGAEGKGLGRLAGERVAIRSSIPMLGHLNSLNVATAGAIAMFEVVRQRAQTMEG